MKLEFDEKNGIVDVLIEHTDPMDDHSRDAFTHQELLDWCYSTIQEIKSREERMWK